MTAPPPADGALAAPAPAPSGRALRLLAIALGLLPPLFVLRVIWRSTVDVPFWDQWELVALIDKSFDEWPTIGDLFAYHNEHRIGFPRLVMLVLARATDWNIRAELAANLAVAVATFFVVLRVARRTTAPLEAGAPFAATVLSILTFSLAAWENWTWGWQLQIFMCVGALTSALALLGANPLGAGRLVAAIVMGAIATFSFGNGALVWPLGLLLIALREGTGRERKLRAAAWSAAAIVLVGLYLVDFGPPKVGQTPTALDLVLYVPVYIGGPLVQWDGRAAAVVGVLGLLALPATVVGLVRAKRLASGDLLTVLGLTAFVLGSAVLTSRSRAGLGLDQAMSSRYATIATHFWLGLVVLLDALTRARADGAGPRPSRLTTYGARAAILTIVVLSLINSERGRVMARRHARKLAPAREALLKLDDDELLGRLYPGPAHVRERVPILRRRGLSLFREDR